ncbi:hypothetical protein RDI58_028863 [Solanum bulbocastanum]|uniref:Uncharacterized protein n=1 Tax=Solanum bulbocastanum TaxID=147425 RepID=A0AAN8SSR2_SOLBU
MKGVLEWVKDPHWLGNERLFCLYGLEKSSSHKLVFGVELGSSVISLHGIRARFIPIWALGSRFSWACA